MKAWVELRGVSRRFGTTEVLRDLSFTLEPRTPLAVVGPSGCGKSTLLRLLAGLEAPTTGEIVMDGRTVSTARTLRVPACERKVALVFQDLALWPNLTVEQNVRLGLAREAADRARRRARAREALELCGIGALARRKPGRLSGGEQQRVALARALALRPRLLLLDEPFSGLDLGLKLQLFQEIERWVREFEISLILVSHDPWEVTRLCRRALVLEQGRIVEHGPLADLLRAPRSETLRAFAQVLPEPART